MINAYDLILNLVDFIDSKEVIEKIELALHQIWADQGDTDNLFHKALKIYH